MHENELSDKIKQPQNDLTHIIIAAKDSGPLRVLES